VVIQVVRLQHGMQTNVAVSYGVQSNKKYLWQSSLGLTKVKAERQALKECAADAKNCKILLSECSLP